MDSAKSLGPALLVALTWKMYVLLLVKAAPNQLACCCRQSGWGHSGPGAVVVGLLDLVSADCRPVGVGMVHVTRASPGVVAGSRDRARSIRGPDPVILIHFVKPLVNPAWLLLTWKMYVFPLVRPPTSWLVAVARAVGVTAVQVAPLSSDFWDLVSADCRPVGVGDGPRDEGLSGVVAGSRDRARSIRGPTRLYLIGFGEVRLGRRCWSLRPGRCTYPSRW